MMDINERIAARREEIARLEKEAAAERVAEQARTRAVEASQREAAAEALVVEINAGGEAEAKREGETVKLVELPDYAMFYPDLKQAAREALFEREVRKRWTPMDQWVIISLIAGGVCLIHLAGLGTLLIVAGIIRTGAVNKRCRRELRMKYPDLFAAVPPR